MPEIRTMEEMIPATVKPLVTLADLQRIDIRVGTIRRVEEIEDPLMRELRYLDKLIDELARGKKMENILRRL